MRRRCRSGRRRSTPPRPRSPPPRRGGVAGGRAAPAARRRSLAEAESAPAAPAHAAPRSGRCSRDRLAGRPTRANFRTGHLTVCTMYPMRSVPHRVVCLLGLDDGAFPRKPPGDGDDVLARRPADRRARPAQRGPPAAARRPARGAGTADHHVHRRRRAHQPAPAAGGPRRRAARHDRRHRPPPRWPPGARPRCIVRHPLQPFDRGTSPPARLVPGGRGASTARRSPARGRCSAGRDATRRPFLDGAAARRPRGDVIALEDLIAFVVASGPRVPARRLGVRLSEPRDEIPDALPVELDHLEGWGVGQRLLDALLAGVEPDSGLPGRAGPRAAAARPARRAGDPTTSCRWPPRSPAARAEAVAAAPSRRRSRSTSRCRTGACSPADRRPARGDVLLQADVLPRAGQAAARPRGSGCSRPPPPIPSGRWSRGSPSAAAAASAICGSCGSRRSATTAAGARASVRGRARAAGRPLRPRDARAAAAARAAPPPPGRRRAAAARTRATPAGEEWSSAAASDAGSTGEDADPEQLLDGGERTLDGAARRAARAGESAATAGPEESHRGSAGSPGGCGTRCSTASR